MLALDDQRAVCDWSLETVSIIKNNQNLIKQLNS